MLHKHHHPIGWQWRELWYEWFFLTHHIHHRFFIALYVAGVPFLLRPRKAIYMATSFNVGQKLPLSISFLDQNGQPMANPPTPDAPPTWSNGSAATDTLTVAPDGLSASDLGVAAGTDTVAVSLAVATVAFSATLAVTVAAAPQVLTSIEIVPGTPA